MLLQFIKSLNQTLLFIVILRLYLENQVDEAVVDVNERELIYQGLPLIAQTLDEVYDEVNHVVLLRRRV